jgi:proline dehydrogenase
MADQQTKELESPVSFENTEKAFSYKSDSDLKKAHFLFSMMNSNFLVRTGAGVLNLSLKIGLPVEGIVKSTIFWQFCGGVDNPSSSETISKIAEYNVKAILDYSAEGATSESGRDATKKELLRTLDYAKDNPNIPFCVFKPTGISDFEVLAKKQAGSALSDEEQKRFEQAKNRIKELCARAYDYQVPLMIDAEESWIQDAVDDICFEMMEQFNKEKAIVFNTYQMYKKSSLDKLKKAIEKAREKGYYFGTKLVRGAYMEKEANRAAEKGYENPIHPNKQATDDAYKEAQKVCIENIDIVSVVSGTHNEYSSKYLSELIISHNIQRSDERVYFSQLLGMSDHISFNLADAGFNVVKYVPYGPVRHVIPYLIRRTEENTSIAGQTSRELLLVKKEMKRRKG